MNSKAVLITQKFPGFMKLIQRYFIHMIIYDIAYINT